MHARRRGVGGGVGRGSFDMLARLMFGKLLVNRIDEIYPFRFFSAIFERHGTARVLVLVAFSGTTLWFWTQNGIGFLIARVSMNFARKCFISSNVYKKFETIWNMLKFVILEIS